MKNITIATSWDDVTLEQFDKLQNIDRNDEFAEAEIIAILANVDIEDILILALEDYNKLAKITEFIKEEPRKCIPTPNLKVADVEFNITMTAQDMTAGQFLDYKALASADIDRKIARLMLCFMIPKGHTYNDGYNTDELLNKIYKNMSVVEVTAYSNFFMLQYQAYSLAMLEYSVRLIKKDKEMSRMKKKFLLERLAEVKATIKSGGCFQ